MRVGIKILPPSVILFELDRIWCPLKIRGCKIVLNFLTDIVWLVTLVSLDINKNIYRLLDLYMTIL
jgi:hypothetical protein